MSPYLVRLPEQPSVSFVLATHNRGPTLLDCLRRTLTCGLPSSQFDVHIVDNASTDDTLARLSDLALEYANVHIHPLSINAGPVAKNVALYGNPADILVLLDDDAYPLPGAVQQMIRHFQDDRHLGAAVFDVTLPDGTKEASAYPDAFIGAGTALRGQALRRLAGPPFPPDFFMQAEEYDLSFRLLADDWSIQRFWDMPLMHLKAPDARVATRTTRLDVRNNLWLLAQYLPEPLCHQFAADWLARYWRMAVRRDELAAVACVNGGSHKGAFLRGAAEGIGHWSARPRTLLAEDAQERFFKFEAIHARLARAMERLGLQRIAPGDWGKNLLAYHQAAVRLGLEVLAIVDGALNRSPSETRSVEYRGVPVLGEEEFQRDLAWHTDAIIVTSLSPVHACRRAAHFRKRMDRPVIDLFAKRVTGSRPHSLAV